MGNLENGVWKTSSVITSDKSTGKFVRQDAKFRQFITKDGSSSFKAEANRYHLYVSYACPWACRTLMMRALKSLEDVITFSVVSPFMSDNGWEFGDKSSNTHDPLYNLQYAYEVYLKADPKYTGKVTVPILWDKKQNTIVSNESAEIIRMLNSEFTTFTSSDYDYYPQKLRPQIDEINDFVYHNINNGVYKCGFAVSQTAYNEAFDNLFNALDKVEAILAKQRYLAGNNITEADIRLFTTLIRFDVVYVGHFKCNLRRIEDYPNLANYLREIYQLPKIKETVNFEHIKQHYYWSHTTINPTQIIPNGPAVNYDRPHNRES